MSARKHFKDGEVIHREGEPVNRILEVLGGKVQLVRDADEAGEGGTAVGLLGPGQMLGADDLVGGMHRTTALAKGRTSLKELDDKAFAALKREKRRDAGWFQRLFGAKAPPPKAAQDPKGGPTLKDWIKDFTRTTKVDPSQLIIRVSPLVEGGDPVSERLVGVLMPEPGLVATALKTPFVASADDWQTVARARELLSVEAADLLVLPSVGDGDGLVTLRLYSLFPADEDLPGCIPAGHAVALPSAVEPPFDVFVRALVGAALIPATDAKQSARLEIIKSLREPAMAVLKEKSRQLLDDHQAGHRVLLAALTCQVAGLTQDASLRNLAMEEYRAALKTLGEETVSLNAALARRHLAALLTSHAADPSAATVAEGADANPSPLQPVREAVGLLEAALQGYTRDAHPLAWAALHNRLGQLYFRLDAAEGETELLRQSLSHYQAALKVYSRAEHGLRWAEVMNNFGQAAAVLGEALSSVEVLEKAVEACRNALGVRRQREFPLLWAASQSNLGLALFILGKLTQDADRVEGSHEAFQRALGVYEGRRARRMIAITSRNAVKAARLLDKLQDPNPPRLPWEPRITPAIAHQTEASPPVDAAPLEGGVAVEHKPSRAAPMVQSRDRF